MPLWEVFLWFLLHFVMYGLLAIYLDQVVPTDYGRTRPWLFFLSPSYWGCAETASGPRDGDLETDATLAPKGDTHALDSDVKAEADRVRARFGLAASRPSSPASATTGIGDFLAVEGGSSKSSNESP